MRLIPILLLTLTLASCDAIEPTKTAVDATSLGPLSSREQALIMGAEGAAAQGNEAAAERDYLSAIAASSGHVEAHMGLARLYQKQEAPQKARAILHEALALQPQHPMANYLLGKSELDANNYEAALDAFEQGLQSQPNDLDLNIGKAVANDMLGQHGAAQLTYTRAMRLNPEANLATARTNLAMSFLLAGEPKKAIDLLLAEGKKPNASSVTRHNLALAYGMLGRHAEAKKLLAGEMDEETRTLTIARLKEYLGNRSGKASGAEAPLKPTITKAPEKTVTKPVTKKPAVPAPSAKATTKPAASVVAAPPKPKPSAAHE